VYLRTVVNVILKIFIEMFLQVLLMALGAGARMAWIPPSFPTVSWRRVED